MFALFEGLSDVYILSTATVALAVIIALYCAHFMKDENEEHKSHHTIPSDEDEKHQQHPSETDSDGELSESFVNKLKSARLKELESALTEDQLEEEKRVEREQLAAIFELLKRQEAELNTKEIDESELTAQMGLYR